MRAGFVRLLKMVRHFVLSIKNALESVRLVKAPADPPWLEIAAKEVGVKEMVGIKHHPSIIKYHQHTSLKAPSDEISWCAAFANYCLETAGFAGTKSPAARSFLKWGLPMEKPERGCIVVFWRGDPNSWQGHVGFFISEDQNGNLRVLGGNQSDSVRISTYTKSRLLGYRWPKDSI